MDNNEMELQRIHDAGKVRIAASERELRELREQVAALARQLREAKASRDRAQCELAAERHLRQKAERQIAAVRIEVMQLRERAIREVSDGEHRYDLAHQRAHRQREDAFTEVLALLDAPASPPAEPQDRASIDAVSTVGAAPVDGGAFTMRPKPADANATTERPAYPTGIVNGPCVCGSWPGGPCLRCEWRPADAPDLLTLARALTAAMGGYEFPELKALRAKIAEIDRAHAPTEQP